MNILKELRILIEPFILGSAIAVVISFGYEAIKIKVMGFLTISIIVATLLVIFLLYKLVLSRLDILIYFKDDDMDIFNIISKKSNLPVFTILTVITGIAGFISFYSKYVPLKSLITLGVSLIALGATLAIVSFNYHNSINEGNDKDLIIFSAKRYYMATIFGVISLSLLIIISIIQYAVNYIQYRALISLVNLILFYIINLSYFFFLFFYGIFMLNTLKFFIEGLSLSIKGSIDLERLKKH